jgi:hypothetical protein
MNMGVSFITSKSNGPRAPIVVVRRGDSCISSPAFGSRKPLIAAFFQF